MGLRVGEEKEASEARTTAFVAVANANATAHDGSVREREERLKSSRWRSGEQRRGRRSPKGELDNEPKKIRHTVGINPRFDSARRRKRGRRRNESRRGKRERKSTLGIRGNDG